MNDILFHTVDDFFDLGNQIVANFMFFVGHDHMLPYFIKVLIVQRHMFMGCNHVSAFVVVRSTKN